jgi:hypothetical protein
LSRSSSVGRIIEREMEAHDIRFASLRRSLPLHVHIRVIINQGTHTDSWPPTPNSLIILFHLRYQDHAARYLGWNGRRAFCMSHGTRCSKSSFNFQMSMRFTGYCSGNWTCQWVPGWHCVIYTRVRAGEDLLTRSWTTEHCR